MLFTATTLSCLSLLGQATLPERSDTLPWTLLVYGAADNNADGPILHFLDDVRKALADDPGMELILFIDRAEGFSNDRTILGDEFTGARIYRLRSDSAEQLDGSAFFPGMPRPGSSEEYEIDSADPENIGRFVAFGKKHFPARKYGLMIYSHADGCTMCPDEESGRDMNIPELTDWVDESASVDFLALELCNMAGIEIGYQWRPGNGGFSAEVLVAIPNAGPPLDWNRAFARIRSPHQERIIEAATSGVGKLPAFLDPADMSALDFGRLVIEEGYAGRRAMLARHPDEAERLGFESAGCFDLNRIQAAKEAIDALAVELYTSNDPNVPNAKEVFEGLRDHGGDPDEPNVVMNYARDNIGARPYVDVLALLERAANCEALNEPTRKAARAACSAVDEVVVASFGMDGFQDFEPGRHGLFIVFPDGDAPSRRVAGANVWSQFGWYSPLEAAYESAPYGRWAFLADGATPGNDKVENWYELLDAWFDDTSERPAGSNRYRW